MLFEIEEIIRRIKELPDIDDFLTDLWDERNNKDIMFSFFDNDCRLAWDKELERRFGQIDLSKTLKELYSKYNGAGHPVRDYLILKNLDLR